MCIVKTIFNFSCDDHLWKRLDLSNRTLLSEVLENVLRRGVQTLRLAKSEVKLKVL